MHVQRFDCLIGIVCCLHYLFFILERSHCDVAVLRVYVNDDLPCGDIQVPYDTVMHCFGLHISNRAMEELLQRLVYYLILSPHSSVLGVHSCGGRNLVGGAGSCYVHTWVGWGD